MYFESGYCSDENINQISDPSFDNYLEVVCKSMVLMIGNQR